MRKGGQPFRQVFENQFDTILELLTVIHRDIIIIIFKVDLYIATIASFALNLIVRLSLLLVLR